MEDGQGRPLWLPDIVGVAPASVLNVPCVIDQEIDDIGRVKNSCSVVTLIVSLSVVRYMILKRLVERYAEYDQTGFLAFHRFDCIPKTPLPLKRWWGKVALVVD